MNPIVRAVDVVKMEIPSEILDLAFRHKNMRWRQTPARVDEYITSLVIRPRVFVDCNLVGGVEALIPLDGLTAELVENYITIYRIPKDRTQGKSIISVLSVGFGSASLYGRIGVGVTNPGSITPVNMAGQAMMDAMGPTPLISTARASLIAENTVMIRDTAPPVANAYIRCRLANDENMSHIQLVSIPYFCELVLLATKAHIYNEMIVELDQAFLSGGQVLGKIKEIIESYADADTMYKEYLRTTWQKVAALNDTETNDRFLRLMIGAHR